MHTLTKVCATLLVSHFVGLTSGHPTWYSSNTGRCECGASDGVSVTFKNRVWCTLRFSSSEQQSHAECMHFIKHTQ